MNRLRGIARLVVSVLALAGCAANQPAPIVDWSSPSATPVPAPVASTTTVDAYRVTRGDTLYAIAFKHGLDYRDLATWNGISAPYTIFAGQELRLAAPAHALPPSTPAAASAAPPTTPLPEPAPGAAVTVGIAEHPAAAPVASAFEDVSAQPPVAEAPKPTEPVPVVAPAAAPAPPPMPTVAEAPLQKPVSEPPVPKPAPLPPKPDNIPELSSGGVTWRWPSEGKVIAAYVSGEPTRQGIDIGGKAGDAVRAAADGEVVYSGNGLIGYGELIIVKHNANFLSAYGHNRSRLVKEGEKVKAGQAIAEMGASAGSRDELHFEIRKNGKPVNPLEYLPAR